MRNLLILTTLLLLLNGCTSLKRAYVNTWNYFDPPASVTP